MKHSYVIVPSNHPILNPEFMHEAKRHGKISTLGAMEASPHSLSLIDA
jgi:hypothetical protein